MKHEIGNIRPESFQEAWPGQLSLFSHYEYVTPVPSALFLITTRKENGNANACLHAWSGFSGDAGGFYAVLTGLLQSGHTLANIRREKAFCVNFLSPKYLKACLATIEHNEMEPDELAAAGLTAEDAKTVSAPRVAEAFLTYECKLTFEKDLSGKGTSALVVGEVQHAAIDKAHTGKKALAGEDGFVYYVSDVRDWETGQICEHDEAGFARLALLDE